MKFYDEGGNRIGCQEWLATYEPYYFLDGPTQGRRITRRNQTSRLVESQVCSLLNRTTPISQEDLILAMAWKIGLIDHHASDAQQKIVFAQGWTATLTASTQFGVRDFSSSIPALAAIIARASTEDNRSNPRYLFDLARKLEGFGSVYMLTVIFFVSGARFPIYDRYAHIAVQAIQEELAPENKIRYKQLSKWSDYERYMNILGCVRDVCPAENRNSSVFVSRSLDRALWVYGHFFNNDTAAPCL
jgi:hypothetical protein